MYPRRIVGPRTQSLVACLLAIGVATTAITAQAPAPGPAPGIAPAAAQPASRLAALQARAPIVDCASLTSADLSVAVGAPTRITSAVAAPDGKPAPYCDAKGIIDSRIQFEVMLPLDGWTQRYLQVGCGGFCGAITLRLENAEGCFPATNGELVLAATDMGHSGQMSDASGFVDAQARIDFAYRGEHLTTLAAKALIQQYYGQGPRYAYFSGCSDGGREALTAAQRFPEDFDGIIAGNPASNFISQNTFASAWSRIVNTGPDGKPILAADKMAVLHNGVLAQCDAADGARDGLLSDPLACRFKGAQIQCRNGQDPATCLTAAQVKVAEEIYAGPHDKDGNRLSPGGLLPGSEVNWAGPVVPPAGEEVGVSSMAESAYKYLAFEKNPPATASSLDMKFDRAGFAAITRLSGLYDATNPQLSAFKARGGKLIIYHGLADPAISPRNTIFYYEQMLRVMGNAAADQFARLYLFPGVSHCGGGEGPFHPQFLAALMAWVEGSQAPNAIVASRFSSDPKITIGLTPMQQNRAGGAPGAGGPPAAGGPPPAGGPPGGPGPGRRPILEPTPTGTLELSRPIYPYPITMRYVGSGSLNAAANFAAGAASRPSVQQQNWLGAGWYAADRALWCTGDGAAMKCSAGR